VEISSALQTTSFQTMNFIKTLSFSALVAISFVAGPAKAYEMPLSNKLELCTAAKVANDRGWSVMPILEQLMVDQGQPKYMAKVIFNHFKSACPKAY